VCREYGIFRRTGYRWINRCNETGPEGLVDRSRRPHSCSHATLEPIENAILALRAKHPFWRARKLNAPLEMLQPDVVWPAASTFGNILSRAGLTSLQRKQKRSTPCSEPFSTVTGLNQLCAWISKATLSQAMESAAILSQYRHFGSALSRGFTLCQI
jgi:hypothetical protein